MKRIGQVSFQESRLKTLEFEEGVEVIGARAFQRNDIETVVLPTTLREVESDGFNGAGLKSVVFSEGLEVLGRDAFRGNSLTEIVLPDSLRELQSGAFFYNQLTKISIPTSVTTLESAVFRWNSLTSVVIPGTVETIEYEAFQGNPLTELTLEEGVKRIGVRAFQDTKLERVTIPASLELIDAAAFEPYDEWGQPPAPHKTVYFAGNAPVLESNGGPEQPDNPPFGSFDRADLVFNCGTTGFTTPVWKGYPTTAECTVSFDSAGGSPVSPVRVAHGSAVTAPEIPTRDGYTFAGWHVASAEGAEYDFLEPVTEPFTLVALWDEILPVLHTVTFDARGGSAVAPAKVEHGKQLSLPADPGRGGYAFTGWFTDVDATAGFAPGEPVLTDVTLFAGWKALETAKPPAANTDGKLASSGRMVSAWWAAAGGAVLLGTGILIARRKISV